MEKQYNDEQKKSFKEACKPVVDWLMKNGHPYLKVVIDTSEAQIFTEQMFANYPIEEEKK